MTTWHLLTTVQSCHPANWKSIIFFTFSWTKWTITPLRQTCMIHKLIFVIQQFSFPFIQIFPSSDLSSSQLRNKISYNFGTTGHRLKIQKAKLVRIKFPIELSNIYLTKTFFSDSLTAVNSWYAVTLILTELFWAWHS